MQSNLKVIFDLLEYPKAEETPPDNATIVKRYPNGRFIQAARELGSLKLKADTAKFSRKVFLYEEANGQYLTLAEIPKEHDDG